MDEIVLRFTPELPTEPGTYLFLGAADVSSVLSGLLRDGAPQTPEIVRVSRTDSGQVRRLGLHFFQAECNTVGLWARLDLDLVQAEASGVVERSALAHTAREAFGGGYGQPPKPVLTSWELMTRLPVGMASIADHVLGRLRDQGVIVRVNPDRPDWDAVWALAGSLAAAP